MMAWTFTLALVEEPTMVAPPVTVQLIAVTPPGAVNVLVEPGQAVLGPVIRKIGFVTMLAVSEQEGALTHPKLLVVINVNV